MAALRRVAQAAVRSFSSSAAPSEGRKVAVLGAAGGIGQPLGLLMKLNPAVAHLALYDIAHTPGVAADISHVNTRAVVEGFVGPEQLGHALAGCDVVIIPAGVPRKPGMTRQDLFNINAGIVKSLIEGCAEHCPKALIAMISNPVNSTVPIAAEVLKRAGVFDPARLFGVTTLDIVRAKTFYGHAKGFNPSDVDIPVIGGHAGKTIIPVWSQVSPNAPLSDEEREALTVRTQNGGTEVVEAKAGKGSATLSMAYAGAVFADSLLKGLNGTRTVECSYVASNITEVPYFSSKVTLGPNGAEEVHGLGELNDYEQAALKAALPELAASIEDGVKFVQGA